MPSNAPTTRNIKVAANAAELAGLCSEFILKTLNDAVASKGSATIAISGGNTPKLLFQNLAKARFDWSKLHVFWVDERCVPPHDDQSNFKLADESWLTPADVPAANIYRIHGELTPDEAALAYIGEVRSALSLATDALPEFDIVHRGMGPDAHTASLFPGEPLIDNETGLAAAVWVEKMKSHRVTLLPGVLKRARTTVLQVAGSDKAEPLKSVLEGADDPKQFPCQIATRNASRAFWFLDEAAAQNL